MRSKGTSATEFRVRDPTLHDDILRSLLNFTCLILYVQIQLS